MDVVIWNIIYGFRNLQLFCSDIDIFVGHPYLGFVGIFFHQNLEVFKITA